MQRLRLLTGLILLAGASPAAAVDGVIDINQAAVFAGGITPGDLPGFPASLSQSGSYRLSGNLDVTKKPDGTGQAGAENLTAVDVLAGNVTLDLNGFAILGPAVCAGNPPTSAPTCAPTGTGRGVSGLAGNVAVVNGTVQGMGAVGVELGGRARTERVRAIGNAFGGIALATNSVAIDCAAIFNGSHGIAMNGINFVISRNLATENAGDGILANGNATATGNTANQNFGSGLALGAGSNATGNGAAENKDFGLQLGAQAGYAQNVLVGNNGGNANPQVSSGIQMPPNVCGTDLVCP